MGKIVVFLRPKAALRADGSSAEYFRGFRLGRRLAAEAFLFGPFEGEKGRFYKLSLVLRPRFRRRNYKSM